MIGWLTRALAPTPKVADMPPDIQALADHLRLYRPVLDAGLEASEAMHKTGDISSHTLLALRRDHLIVDKILSGFWGYASIGQAYQSCANLTPLVERGLRKAGTKALLHKAGVTDAWNYWREPFRAYGMYAIHGNTGAPTWPAGTSC